MAGTQCGPSWGPVYLPGAGRVWQELLGGRAAGCGENSGCGCPGQASVKAARNKPRGRWPSSDCWGHRGCLHCCGVTMGTQMLWPSLSSAVNATGATRTAGLYPPQATAELCLMVLAPTLTSSVTSETSLTLSVPQLHHL